MFALPNVERKRGARIDSWRDGFCRGRLFDVVVAAVGCQIGSFFMSPMERFMPNKKTEKGKKMSLGLCLAERMGKIGCQFDQGHFEKCSNIFKKKFRLQAF